MSRDIATTATASSGSSLISEMFSNSAYKPNQGRFVRQLTALAIWVVVAMACWSLYGTLRASLQAGSLGIPVIPAVTLMIGLWFGYRAVNWPRFADFLIAVEAEMNKVTWPGKDELKRASFVVIFTIFFLAIALFAFDVVWQAIFSAIGVTS